MRTAILLSVLCVSSLSTACAAKKPPPPVTVQKTSVTPELKAALELATSCKYEEGAFDPECDGFKAWQANTELANAGLLEMVSSEDAKVRALVVDKLRVQLTADNIDKESLSLFLDAAEAEKTSPIAKTFARTVAGIDAAKLGLLDRSIAIAKAHSASGYQETYASALRSETEADKVVAYAGELAKSEDTALRHAALRMYEGLEKTHPEAACKGMDALRADKDSAISQQATSGIAREARCISQYDGVLTSLEEMDLPQNPGAAEPFVGTALEGICRNEEKTSGQRDRSLALAKKISQTTSIKADTRSSALSAVLACDPKGGPALLKKFAKDKDATVAERAKSLLESIPKKTK